MEIAVVVVTVKHESMPGSISKTLIYYRPLVL